MKKHEKFVLLSEYYKACHKKAYFGVQLEDAKIGDGTILLYRAFKAKAELIETLVEKFYAGKPESDDSQEMEYELGKVRELAGEDSDAERWKTEKMLFEMFEGDCLDDDENRQYEWINDEEARKKERL